MIPTLTVVTVSLFNDDALSRTIESIRPLHSLLGDKLEHIIVSPDQTCSNLNNVRFVFKEKNGIYPAMNKGIAEAKGLYIWLLNAGDECLDPELITRLTQIHDTRALHVICSPVVRMYLNGFQSKYSGGVTKPHQGILYLKNVFTDIGNYREDYKLISDRLHFDEIRQSDVSILVNHEPVALFMMDGASSSVEGWRRTRNEYFHYFIHNPTKILYFYRALKLSFRLIRQSFKKSSAANNA